MGLPAPDELRTPAVSIQKLQRMNAGLNISQAAEIPMPPNVPMKILMALNKGLISKIKQRASLQHVFSLPSLQVPTSLCLADVG
jgi:hypothetical protein